MRNCRQFRTCGCFSSEKPSSRPQYATAQPLYQRARRSLAEVARSSGFARQLAIKWSSRSLTLPTVIMVAIPTGRSPPLDTTAVIRQACPGLSRRKKCAPGDLRRAAAPRYWSVLLDSSNSLNSLNSLNSSNSSNSCDSRDWFDRILQKNPVQDPSTSFCHLPWDRPGYPKR